MGETGSGNERANGEWSLRKSQRRRKKKTKLFFSFQVHFLGKLQGWQKGLWVFWFCRVHTTAASVSAESADWDLRVRRNDVIAVRIRSCFPDSVSFLCGKLDVCKHLYEITWGKVLPDMSLNFSLKYKLIIVLWHLLTLFVVIVAMQKRILFISYLFLFICIFLPAPSALFALLLFLAKFKLFNQTFLSSLLTGWTCLCCSGLALGFFLF